MISAVFHTWIYEPLYNILAFVVGMVPGGDVGIAIIAVTVIVRLALFPISLKASRTQLAMRELDPKLRELRAQLKDDREGLARATMALFKEHKINPFAGFLLILVQLPIIIGLYLVFFREGGSASFDPLLLYTFVPIPDIASFSFLGLVDLTARSWPLALFVAVSQFFYARLTMPIPQKTTVASTPSFSDDLTRSMNIQMRYVFPIVLGVVSYFATAAVALYFVASNIFGIAQELVVQRLHPRHDKTRNS